MTYEEMLDWCQQNRESDGFCRICGSCSGPSQSNLACDYPMPKGMVVYRGGNHGGCRFEVSKAGM